MKTNLQTNMQKVSKTFKFFQDWKEKPRASRLRALQKSSFIHESSESGGVPAHFSSSVHQNVAACSSRPTFCTQAASRW